MAPRLALLALLLIAAPPAHAESGITPPRLLEQSPAQPPPGWNGAPSTVELLLRIDSSGNVAELAVQGSPEPSLADAARRAAAGLRFEPARDETGPIEVQLPFVYRFEPAPAALAGQVRAMGRRRPIPFATVTVEGLEPVPADAEGRFELHLAPGDHWIRVQAEGFRATAQRESVASGERVEVVYGLEPLAHNPYQTVVRGGRERTEVSRVELREQELREVPGTQGDPFRAVMLMPGVASLASGLGYPVVRGAQPAATGFFLDGVRIPTLYHLMLGPAVVHPDFIDGLDFMAGAPPARYGRLIGGAIEGHLTRPREDRLHATAYADLLNTGGFVEYPFESTGTSVSLAGRFSYSGLLAAAMGNLFPPRDPGQTSWAANFWDYQGRVEQKVGAGTLRLLALGSSDLVRLRPDQPEGIAASAATSFHRLDLRGRHPLLGGEGELGVTLGRDGLGAFGDRANRRVGTLDVSEQSVAARALFERALGARLKLAMGGDVQHRRGFVSITGAAVAPGTRGVDAASALRQPSSIATISGAFAELQWKPSARWTVTPGVRADAWHLNGSETLFSAEPRLAVRFSPLESLTLRGGAGLHHQPPTVLVPLPVAEIAGLRWGLQRALQFDVGATWKLPKELELSADVYFNPMLRTVEFAPNEVLESRRRRDAPAEDPSSRGYAWGGELMLRHPLGRNWFGWVSYSFQQSRRLTAFNRYDDQDRIIATERAYLPFAFEQQHVLNAAISYRFPGNVTAGAVVHFNTGRPESGQVTSQTHRLVEGPDGSKRWVRVDGDRVERLPAFVRVDLRVAKSWAFDTFLLDVYLDVLNASAQSEVYGFAYNQIAVGPDAATPDRSAFEVPVLLPVLGVKGTW